MGYRPRNPQYSDAGGKETADVPRPRDPPDWPAEDQHLAALYRAIGQRAARTAGGVTVSTPRGQGRLVQVAQDRVSVVIGGRVAFFPPSEVDCPELSPVNLACVDCGEAEVAKHQYRCPPCALVAYRRLHAFAVAKLEEPDLQFRESWEYHRDRCAAEMERRSNTHA